MEDGLPWDQLAKYFAGELSEEKEIELKKWIHSDPERKLRVERIQQAWNEAQFYADKINVNNAWNRLSQQLDRKSKNTVDAGAMQQESVGFDSDVRNVNKISGYYDQRKSKKRKRSVAGYYFLAASVVLIAAVSLMVFFSGTLFNSAEDSVILQQLETREGERAKYVLSDGSTVVLHAESRLDVPVQFTDSSRDIYLEGEAFFEVEHDSNRPFIVHSENSQTRVLGTRFLVRTWSNAAGEVEVIVEEGKVAFGKRSEPGSEEVNEVFIETNQRGTLSRNTNPEIFEVKDLGWYMGWVNGTLYFEDRALSELIPKLESWYVIDIELENENLGELPLSGEIDFRQPMSETLKSIAISLGLEISRDDRTITFSK